MSFNYSKLLGKIKECGYTQETLAKEIKLNPSTLNLKLKNKSVFTAIEVAKISNVLKINPIEIGDYFFTV